MSVFLGAAECLHNIVALCESVHPKTNRPGFLLVISHTLRERSGKPNALLVHFPVPSSKVELIDCNAFPAFPRDLLDAITPQAKAKRGSSVLDGLVLELPGFDLPLYQDVQIASNIDSLARAIQTLPQERRPELSNEWVQWYQRNLKGYSIAACHFAAGASGPCMPLVFWYETASSDAHLTLPVLKARDGQPPRLDQVVVMDDWVILGGKKERKNLKPVDYVRTPSPNNFVLSLLPSYIHGEHYHDKLPNGDLFGSKDFCLRSSTVKLTSGLLTL